MSSDASIEIPVGAYIVGVWHYELPKHLSKFHQGGNCLVFLYRESGQTKWKVSYRFRHYRDIETVWKSKDFFSSYFIEISALEEYSVRSKIDQWVQLSALLAGGQMVDYSDVRGDAKLAFDRLGNLPWFHVKAEAAA